MKPTVIWTSQLGIYKMMRNCPPELGNSSQANHEIIPPPCDAAFISSVSASSSSRQRLSLTEADTHETDSWTGPQRQTLVQDLSNSTSLSQLDIILSSLPPELCRLIISWVPIERLMEWCLVCKEWKTLILSGDLNGYGHHIQPSTRNGFIISIIENSIIENSVWTGRIILSVKTYCRRLNIWQDGSMPYFFQEINYSSSRTCTSGGLLCLYTVPVLRDFINVCNPITKECRRLKVPLASEVDETQPTRNSGGTLLWGIIVEKQPDRYRVVVRDMTMLQNEQGGESLIRRILVYNSVSGLWEMGGTLSSDISDRVGDHVSSSSSSRGKLYFLSRPINGTAFQRRTPCLIEFDAQNKRCREISPLPKYIGRGQPVLVEHRGDILFVTRNLRQRSGRRRYHWVFFRLEETSILWVEVRDTPEDVADQLDDRITAVRCHGNGDLVYFYGVAKGLLDTVSVLVHDLVENSWVWLRDVNQISPGMYSQLLSIQPSFIKV